MHGGQHALFGRCVQKLTQKAFFRFQVQLVLHHRVRGLHVVRDEPEKAEEIALLRHRARGLDREEGVCFSRLQHRENDIGTLNPFSRAEVLERHVQQFHGTLEKDVASREMDRPVNVEMLFAHR